MRTHPLIGGARAASGTGTVYVTTGGGGGFLHTASNQPFVAFYESAYHYLRCELEGPRLTIQAVAGDGREIDRYTLAPAPQLQAGSVVNSATFKPSMAPGGLVSIFGLALGSGERAARTLPLPQELSATTVSLAGVRIPLLYVSATQINAQLPFGFQGRQTLIVTTPNGSAQTEIDAAPTAPAVFTVYPPQGAVAAVVHTSGALVSAGAPAAPGEVVSVYLTGLGWVQGGVQEGQAAPVFPLARTVATVEAMLAGRALATAYAGLAPGFAGLYQVNVKIPEDIAPGSYPLRIVAEAVASDPVSLPVGY
jgi:uncharacterized protein (TIGR03437 family)